MRPDDWHLRVIEVAGANTWVNDATAWSFLLLRSGAAAFSGRAGYRLLKPGDLLVAPAGVAGTLSPASIGGCAFLHFHFHAELLNGFLRLEERHSLQALVAVGVAGVKCFRASTPLARRYRFLSERIAPADTLRHRCQLLELVGMFLDRHRIELRPTPVAALDGTARVRLLVEQMPRAELERVHPEELAKRCGCSRRHLNRILRACLGCSFGALRRELRLEKAAALLLSPGTKVMRVALDCGFSHSGQFSAKFKNHFGTTPAAWRRQRLRDTVLVTALPRLEADLKAGVWTRRCGVAEVGAGGSCGASGDPAC
jgi:AraC-like DNA-binding protein